METAIKATYTSTDIQLTRLGRQYLRSVISSAEFGSLCKDEARLKDGHMKYKQSSMHIVSTEPVYSYPAASQDVASSLHIYSWGLGLRLN